MVEQSQIQAAKRHLFNTAATTFTILAAIALLPKPKGQALVDNLHIIGDSVTAIMGAVSNIWLLLGPVVLGICYRGAFTAGSFLSQVKQIITKAASNTVQGGEAKAALVQAVDGMVVNNSDAKSTDIKVAIVNAAAKISDKVVAPDLASNPNTASNVVSS